MGALPWMAPGGAGFGGLVRKIGKRRQKQQTIPLISGKMSIILVNGKRKSKNCFAVGREAERRSNGRAETERGILLDRHHRR